MKYFWFVLAVTWVVFGVVDTIRKDKAEARFDFVMATLMLVMGKLTMIANLLLRGKG